MKKLVRNYISEIIKEAGFDRPLASSGDQYKQDTNSFDLKYHQDQLNKLIQGLMDFEQELATELEQVSDQTGDLTYSQMINQVQRYLNGSERQLDGLSKYLKRQQKNL